jgi:hypothetical protein
MTITSDVLEAEGLGNGAAFDFSFAPLKIFRIAEGANAGKHTLRVVFVAANGDITPLEEGVGADKYSLVGTFDGVTARTGSIKYPQDESTPIPTGSKVVMVVAVPLLQQNGIPNQGGWFPKTQEGMFDRLTLIDQQLQEQVDRAIKVPLGSSTDPDELIATLTADAAAATDAKIAAEAAQELSEDWASKTDGQVASTDYSSKAYAVGGTGTETNNSKYYSEQAALSAASVNLPSIIATDTGSLVQVNAAGTGYDKLTPGTSGKFLMSNGADAALSYEDIPSQAQTLVLLSTQTASSSATIDFTSLITSTYKNYIILFDEVIPQTDSANLWFRTSNDNGSNYQTTTYAYSINKASSADAGYDALQAATQAQIIITASVGSAAGESASGVIYLYDPLATNYTKISISASCVDSDGNIAQATGAAARLTVEAVNAVRFLMSTGNITSGTFKLYGVL